MKIEEKGVGKSVGDDEVLGWWRFRLPVSKVAIEVMITDGNDRK